MGTHWNAINDFMMGKYLHKRLYESYPQRPVHFVDFLANSSYQTYFLYLMVLGLRLGCKKKLVVFNQENNQSFFDKSIYLRLAFKSHCFHGHTWNDIKCSYILFLIKYKNRNIILKTEQTTIVYAQCDRMMW